MATLPEDKPQMPSMVAETHDLLGRELLVLYTKWNDYKALYCKDDETVGLLKYAALFFFHIVEQVLRDDIILSVCRITDPATSTVHGATKDNLSIEYLTSTIPETEGELKQTLADLIETIETQCVTFREHRNRRISHGDRDARLKRKQSLLWDIGIDAADKALQRIACALNAVAEHYGGKTMAYEVGIYGQGSGAELIDFIERAQALERCWNNKEFGDPI